ncbi:MAG: hypothetical protein GX230_02795 [Lentisphaerae bacterium]|nr:hypothetical protein [Lentisphaerota bacterium]
MRRVGDTDSDAMEGLGAVHLTEAIQWREWLELCALGRCLEHTAYALSRFSGFHFRRYVGMALGGEAELSLCLGDRDCFHLLETTCMAERGKNSKKYKKWLACRQGSGEGVEGYDSGASLLLRDAARVFDKAAEGSDKNYEPNKEDNDD